MQVYLSIELYHNYFEGYCFVLWCSIIYKQYVDYPEIYIGSSKADVPVNVIQHKNCTAIVYACFQVIGFQLNLNKSEVIHLVDSNLRT